VKFLRKFDIDIIRLKEGEHQFKFEIDQEFLDHFEKINDVVSKSNLIVEVVLDKRVNIIEADFIINGSVELTCDRSLELFDQPLETRQKILYKYGEEEKEISDEIYTITRDTQSINVAQLIYEFILLSIPAKKIHPDHLDEMDEEESEDDGWIVYSAGNEDEDGENEEIESNNPFWDALKNLKNKE